MMAEPWLNRLNRWSHYYHRLKTMFYYRPMFKAIGAGTTLRRPLLVTNPQCIRIGKNVLIRDGVRMEVVLMPRRGDGGMRVPDLTIGDNTNIEQNVHIVCHSRIMIGANVSITGNCAVVDVTHPYQDIEETVKIGARILDDDAYVEIGEGSFIGMGTVILPNVRIGKHAVVGANSVVASDLPDYCVAAGAPARVMRRYDHTTRRWEKVVENASGIHGN